MDAAYWAEQAKKFAEQSKAKQTQPSTSEPSQAQIWQQGNDGHQQWASGNDEAQDVDMEEDIEVGATRSVTEPHFLELHCHR
jgi:hypothetical protein